MIPIVSSDLRIKPKMTSNPSWSDAKSSGDELLGHMRSVFKDVFVHDACVLLRFIFESVLIHCKRLASPLLTLDHISESLPSSALHASITHP